MRTCHLAEVPSWKILFPLGALAGEELAANPAFMPQTVRNVHSEMTLGPGTLLMLHGFLDQ